MKVKAIERLHVLTGAILHAEKQVTESLKRPAKGYGNLPQIGLAYDQSGAGDMEEIAAAREKLSCALTEVFRQYRSDLLKILDKTEGAKDAK